MANTFQMNFNEFLSKIEDLIKEGNLRRIIVRDQHGEKYLEVPLLVGAIGSLAAPYITLIGVLAGVMAKFSVEIIKKDESQTSEVYEVKK
ncbi:MAG: DUF4342 domain-containing protein [Ignavibacteriae bacterium]|nr:DUF4342 domain-containing protein [Ignavibacteriota bacterium]